MKINSIIFNFISCAWDFLLVGIGIGYFLYDKSNFANTFIMICLIIMLAFVGIMNIYSGMQKVKELKKLLGRN